MPAGLRAGFRAGFFGAGFFAADFFGAGFFAADFLAVFFGAALAAFFGAAFFLAGLELFLVAIPISWFDSLLTATAKAGHDSITAFLRCSACFRGYVKKGIGNRLLRARL
jgi:hypothetical protein